MANHFGNIVGDNKTFITDENDGQTSTFSSGSSLAYPGYGVDIHLTAAVIPPSAKAVKLRIDGWTYAAGSTANWRVTMSYAQYAEITAVGGAVTQNEQRQVIGNSNTIIPPPYYVWVRLPTRMPAAGLTANRLLQIFVYGLGTSGTLAMSSVSEGLNVSLCGYEL